MNIFDKIDEAIKEHLAVIKVNREISEILSNAIKDEIDKEILTNLNIDTQ